jgi:hypothetical protein
VPRPELNLPVELEFSFLTGQVSTLIRNLRFLDLWLPHRTPSPAFDTTNLPQIRLQRDPRGSDGSFFPSDRPVSLAKSPDKSRYRRPLLAAESRFTEGRLAVDSHLLPCENAL